MAKRVEWISREQWLAERQAMTAVLSSWEQDWESLDHERYQRHYSREELDAFGRDFPSWNRHKRWVNGNKKWVDVEYRNLSVFNYPGEDGLMLMQFEQSYRSDNYNVDSTKELYWRKQQQQWQIVYEGKRAFPAGEKTIASN